MCKTAYCKQTTLDNKLLEYDTLGLWQQRLTWRIRTHNSAVGCGKYDTIALWRTVNDPRPSWIGLLGFHRLYVRCKRAVVVGEDPGRGKPSLSNVQCALYARCVCLSVYSVTSVHKNFTLRQLLCCVLCVCVLCVVFCSRCKTDGIRWISERWCWRSCSCPVHSSPLMTSSS